MENITLAVTGITTIDKLVLRFSKDLPARGIAWRNYEVLDAEQKALVDEMVPDENANGKPKAKFARQYIVAFEDTENGRKYLFDCKVTCFDGGNKPWSMYIPLLEQIGPKVSGEINMDDYFKVDDMYQATLMREDGEKYWHLNLNTLRRV